MIMLLLESEKLLYLPDPVSTAGYQRSGIYSGTVKLHVGLLVSQLQCCTNGTKITAFNFASLPHRISGKRNDDCIAKSSIIHSPAAAAASASLLEPFGQLHMHGKGGGASK
jgi:hypothetical protein